jgi:alkaline phosphatase D
VWGHSFGTIGWRTDLANLPEGMGPKWPGAGFALENGGYYSEHAQIYDALRKKGVTGLAVVAGDKHSFWAGLTSADLPPRDYHPMGVEFITGSISAQGFVELGELIVKPDHSAARAVLHRRAPRNPLGQLHVPARRARRARVVEDERRRGAASCAIPAVAPHLKFVIRRTRIRPGYGDHPTG